MQKTVTEYEPAEETQEYIQCEECDERWDNRGIRGKQGVYTLALDPQVQTYRHYHRGEWRTKDIRESSRHLTGRKARLSADNIVDFCSDHYDSLYDRGLGVKAEELDYYVSENERTVYVCDFCEKEMGEEVDHTVAVNLYLKQTVRHGISVIMRDSTGDAVRPQEETKCIYEFGKSIRIPQMSAAHSGTVRVKADKMEDCCHECAARIFDLTRTKQAASAAKRSPLAVFLNRLLSFNPI